MPADASNRTLVLSVVAVDLVAYSQKSVAEQMSLKDHFNQVLLQAIRDIPIADRIILDTGDGVAMGFLGDPEDALYVAMFMHDAINRDSAGSPSGGADGGVIRIGINLGPVKLATGVGGHPNIIGDGINVAERIMGFAEPGQFTASRPVFEVMSRMSDHYATLFQYAGVHTDKQVRAHDVYLVGKSAAAFHHAQRGVAERTAARAGQPVIPPVIAKVFAQVPALPPVKTASPAPAPAAKRDTAPAAAAGKAQESAVTVTKAVTSPQPRVIATGERNHALIDFLEDRNKVAITATLLAVIAVTLAALLAYRKMLILQPGSPAPAVAALTPAPATKVASPAEILPPSIPVPTIASPAETSASVAAPVKTVEPPPPSPRSGAAAPSVARDTAKAAKDVKPERPERSERAEKPAPREEIRTDARKPALPRTPEREKPPTGTAAPIMPTYQSPAATPRPEAVAPTQTLPPPAVAVPDTRIVAISRVDPAYPIEATRQSINSGLVRAKITIDASGNVSDIVILESRPISAFGRETRLTAKQWKFNPGAAGRVQEFEISFKP